MTDDIDTTTEQRAAEGKRDQSGRYGSFETADGELLVYDRENPGAWIQADVGLDAEAIR